MITQWKLSNSGRSLPELITKLSELKNMLSNQTFGNIRLEHLECLNELIIGFNTQDLIEDKDYSLQFENINDNMTQLRNYILTLQSKLEDESKLKFIKFHPITLITLIVASLLMLTLLIILI